MARYTATIRHHSIARARVVDLGDDITAAKRRATAEFRGDYNDYVVVIMDATLPEWDNIVASRRLGDRKLH